RFLGSTALGHALDLGAQNYTDTSLWAKLIVSKALEVFNDLGVNITTPSDTMGVGGLAVRNDVRAAVEASIVDATVDAGEDVVVSALETATIVATDDTIVSSDGAVFQVKSGNSTAAAFTLATNLVLSSAQAL